MHNIVEIRHVMGSQEIVHHIQVSDDLMGRSCTPHLNSPTFRTHDRHSTKIPLDDDDNFWISVNVSRCRTSNVPTTSDVLHDGCTP